MRILILGHYEIASNYAISLLLEHLKSDSGYDFRVALSGKGDKKLEQFSQVDTDSKNNFSKLAAYERLLCNELNQGKDPLELKTRGFDQIATETGKPISLLLNPNSEKGLRKLKKWKPDLIVSIRYRKIFQDAAIRIPRLGIINLHSGLLPEYRGAMATFWSMLNKEEYFGSTLHYISDRGIDTGAIIQRNLHKLNYQKTYLENVLSLYPLGVQAILFAIDALREKSRIDVQISKNKGNYFSFPSASDLCQFEKEGGQLY